LISFRPRFLRLKLQIKQSKRSFFLLLHHPLTRLSLVVKLDHDGLFSSNRQLVEGGRRKRKNEERTFSSNHLFTASVPYSLPRPLCLYPPKGR
jgi:hypothetical protein